jgi:flagellar biosynthesis/type III secretory pathway protein FliH
MLTVHLAGPISVACLADAVDDGAVGGRGEWDGSQGMPGATSQSTRQKLEQVEGCEQELAQSCRLVKNIAEKLNGVYEETIARSRSDIARLAVEIARKILMRETDSGHYAMQALVEEALKCAPTRQDIVVRVNPQDLSSCQRLQQDDPNGPLVGLEFVADWSIARADCLVETPKGIVKSFIEERLARIGEALTQVE